ncbi:MAG: hypothetical protein ACFFDN_00445 [Candidatus Hodarchaeota archaeon]
MMKKAKKYISLYKKTKALGKKMAKIKEDVFTIFFSSDIEKQHLYSWCNSYDSYFSKKGIEIIFRNLTTTTRKIIRKKR